LAASVIEVPSRRALFCGLGALAAAIAFRPSAVRAVIDARTVHPMRLRVLDWLNLVASDRTVFLEGFSVGWHHGLDDGEAFDSDNASTKLATLDLQLIRLANTPATAESFLVTALTRATLLGRLPHLAVDGSDWKRLQMRHQMLILQALVAGAHARAVWQALGEPFDTTTIGKGVEYARALVPSPFPINPNVMLSRLLDYYGEPDNLETPLARAVEAVGRRRLHLDLDIARTSTP
jgi:hypothetical protein